MTRFDLEAFRMLFHRPTSAMVENANRRVVRCACEGHALIPKGEAWRVTFGVSGERGLLLCYWCAAFTLGIVSERRWRSEFTFN